MSLHASTIPGVLIDESDDARAQFIAAREGKLNIPDRLPTQAEILFTARWLHMDPYEVALNNDVNFNELEPGDLSEADQLRYQPAMARSDLAWLVTARAIAVGITIAAVAGGAGWVWRTFELARFSQ